MTTSLYPFDTKFKKRFKIKKKKIVESIKKKENFAIVDLTNVFQIVVIFIYCFTVHISVVI